MNITFIGHGRMAIALAGKWRSHHTVVFAGRDDERAATAASTLGIGSATPEVAVNSAEIVVLATSADKVFEAIKLAGGADAFAGKTVVDINNPVNISTFLSELPGGQSLTEAIAEALPDSQIIKAFNMAAASVWGHEDMNYGGQPAMTLYTADDEKTKSIGAQLIRDVGAEPRWVGGSEHAVQLEAAAMLVIKQLFGDSPSHSFLQFVERG